MTICAESDGRSWQHCTRGMTGCVCGTDNLHRAAEILEVFNRWRREEKMPDGSDAQQPHPAAIGGAIETAIAALRSAALASPSADHSEDKLDMVSASLFSDEQTKSIMNAYRNSREGRMRDIRDTYIEALESHLAENHIADAGKMVSAAPLSDEKLELDDLIIKALTEVKSKRLWDTLTYESGPYSIDKPTADAGKFVVYIAEAIITRALARTAPAVQTEQEIYGLAVLHGNLHTDDNGEKTVSFTADKLLDFARALPASPSIAQGGEGL